MYLKNFQKQSFMMPDKWDPKIVQHSYHLFNIFLDKKRDGISRDEAISKLHKKKIGVGVHYRAIPEHSIYRKLFNWKINDFPNAKKIGRETISLPLSPSLKEQEIKIVINAIKKIAQ